MGLDTRGVSLLNSTGYYINMCIMFYSSSCVVYISMSAIQYTPCILRPEGGPGVKGQKN